MLAFLGWLIFLILLYKLLLKLVNHKEERNQATPLRWALSIGEYLSYHHALTIPAYDLVPLNQDDQARMRPILEQTFEAQGDDLVIAARQWLASWQIIPYAYQEPLLIECLRSFKDSHILDLVAFESARVAFKIRLLVGCQVLASDDPEMMKVLYQNAKRVSDCFSSWEDFNNAFIRGRTAYMQWRSTSKRTQIGPKTETQFFTLFNAYLEKTSCSQHVFDFDYFAQSQHHV